MYFHLALFPRSRSFIIRKRFNRARPRSPASGCLIIGSAVAKYLKDFAISAVLMVEEPCKRFSNRSIFRFLPGKHTERRL